MSAPLIETKATGTVMKTKIITNSDLGLELPLVNNMSYKRTDDIPLVLVMDTIRVYDAPSEFRVFSPINNSPVERMFTARSQNGILQIPPDYIASTYRPLTLIFDQPLENGREYQVDWSLKDITRCTNYLKPCPVKYYKEILGIKMPGTAGFNKFLIDLSIPTAPEEFHLLVAGVVKTAHKSENKTFVFKRFKDEIDQESKIIRPYVIGAKNLTTEQAQSTYNVPWGIDLWAIFANSVLEEGQNYEFTFRYYAGSQT